MNYHVFSASATDAGSLALATADFLENEFQLKDYRLLSHVSHPDPIKILRDKYPTLNINKWLNDNSFNSKAIDSTHSFEQQGVSIFFSGNDFLNEKIYIFIFKSNPGPDILDVLKQWQLRHQYLKNIHLDLNTELEISQGNLVSQLLHDVQSLMDFQPLEITDPEHTTRLNYQNSVNENLLFYVRPIDLLTFKSPVIELIYASVQILGIEKNDFSLRVLGEIADIDLDAELFSKALNAIVLNAQESGSGTPVKWKIQIEQYAGVSPFIDQSWLQISIIDQGPGIKPDYLPFISDPFFTTKKVAGHSGFGLTSAKKILDAHGGSLQITSVVDQGTQVKLIFPYRDDESKNSDN